MSATEWNPVEKYSFLKLHPRDFWLKLLNTSKFLNTCKCSFLSKVTDFWKVNSKGTIDRKRTKHLLLKTPSSSWEYLKGEDLTFYKHQVLPMLSPHFILKHFDPILLALSDFFKIFLKRGGLNFDVQSHNISFQWIFPLSYRETSEYWREIGNVGKSLYQENFWKKMEKSLIWEGL